MKIGSVTSGTFSSSLKIPIAMGYVNIEQADSLQVCEEYINSLLGLE